MSMNKSKLVRAIAAKAMLKLSDAEKFINAFIDTVKEELRDGGNVKLTGFGTFSVVFRKEKRGINPRTGDRITLKEKHVPCFKPSKNLLRSVYGVDEVLLVDSEKVNLAKELTSPHGPGGGGDEFDGKAAIHGAGEGGDE